MQGYPVVTTADWCGDHKLSAPKTLAPTAEDPWAHRSIGMRCASCMYFVEKKA